MKKTWIMLAMAAMIALGAAGAQAQSYTYGDEADEIATVQQALTELKLYYADITGYYGRKTETAVTLFQKKYGLPQTGVADKTTLERLYLAADMSAPTSSAPAITSTTVLRRGSSGRAVRQLQENLTTLGYYKGEITGHYGGLTQEAVRKFQKKNDLDSDGIAGRNTLGKIAVLMGDSVGSAGGTTASGATSSAGTDDDVTILRLNVRNDAVRKLQEDLTVLGYYSGTVTGKYGSLTKEAVRRFQRDNDLASDGVAGPLTLAEIADELSDKVGDAADLSAIPGAGTATSTTTDTVAAVNWDDVSLLNTERTLRYSSRSGYVTRLQKALGALGYYQESADGYFGSKTEAAVKAYQAAKGLGVDGVAGRNTLTAINKDIQNRIVGSVD